MLRFDLGLFGALGFGFCIVVFGLVARLDLG